jgi:hypothetical protein
MFLRYFTEDGKISGSRIEEMILLFIVIGVLVFLIYEFYKDKKEKQLKEFTVEDIETLIADPLLKEFLHKTKNLLADQNRKLLKGDRIDSNVIINNKVYNKLNKAVNFVFEDIEKDSKNDEINISIYSEELFYAIVLEYENESNNRFFMFSNDSPILFKHTVNKINSKYMHTISMSWDEGL